MNALSKYTLLSTVAAMLLIGCGSGTATDSSTTPTEEIAQTPVDTVKDTTEIPMIDEIPVEEPEEGIAVRPKAGWYGKTKVYAELDGKVYQHTTAGVFGELKESSDLKDQHDIPGFGTALLQVVFPQTTWAEEENGDYFSNYQSYSEAKQEWIFQVKNQKEVNLANATLKIELEGVYDVTYESYTEEPPYLVVPTVNKAIEAKLTLIDIDNQISYSAKKLPKVKLGMDGMNVRTFKWVRGEVDANDYAVEGTLLQSAISTKNTLVSKVVEEETKSNSKFGTPPTLR